MITNSRATLFLSRAIRRLSLPQCGNSRHLSSTSNMNQQQQQDQPQLKCDNLKPEISPEAQKQQQEGGVPPAKPTGSLQDMDPNKLMAKRNQILWEQAQRGEQPGLMLMQDALSGEKKAQTWGNEPTNKEPDEQN